LTFNTPVGAPAASQCGRVMFNDYHVIAPTGQRAFPAECPTETKMSAQEEMLEYALFDLSTFVQPVVVPTLSMEFNPGPLIVKSGDTSEQVTVNVTNTSSSNAIESSAILTFTLPQLMTATAMTDSTGGWVCNVGTLTCTRNSSLAASTSDSVTLTMNMANYPAGGLSSYTGQITATVSSVTFSSDVTASDNVIYQQVPSIAWTTPAPIVYGTPLSATQLDAASTVPGSFTYSPAIGTVLSVGQQTVSVTFTPNNAMDYTTTTANVTLNVLPVTPAISLASSANPVFMTYAVSFTASLPAFASSQTGTMTFFDGTTQIGSSALSGGAATLTTTALAAGPHSITVTYSGDSNYGPATSEAIPETIQDFTLAFAGNGNGVANVPSGGQATYTLVVTPVGGTTFPENVTLAASSVPYGMNAVFSPATLNPGSGPTSVKLQIALPGNIAKDVPLGPLGKGAAPLALAFVLLPFVGRLRKGRARLMRLMMLVVVSATLALGLSSCSQATFTSQIFSFTVTASSGSLSHSVTPELTVQ
jgi:hypothetical protein